MNRTANQHKTSLNQIHKRVLLERILQGNYPPHLLITFAFHKVIGWPADRIVAEFYQEPLSVVEWELEKQLVKEGFEKSYASNLFQPLRLMLKKPLNVIQSKQFARENKTLLTEIAGHTRLSDYFKKEPEKTISEFWNSIDELILIVEAIQNKPNAFDRLYQTVDEQVLGFIRFKLDDDTKAKDIAQETRLKVWEKLSEYNPAFRPFIAFVKYRAALLIKQEWNKARRNRDFSLDDLIFEFPDPNEGEIPVEEITPRTDENSPESHPFIEEDLNEQLRLYSILWKVTFQCEILPHLLITFGFNKLLGEKPANIVADKSDKTLQTLGELLEEELISRSQLPENFIRANMVGLYRNLKKSFDDFNPDPRTKKTLPPPGGRKIGRTNLKEYYRIQPPEKNIPMWSQVVQRKVQQCLNRYLKTIKNQETKNSLL